VHWQRLLTMKYRLIMVTLAVALIGTLLFSIQGTAAAPQCTPPGAGNWVITSSCDITGKTVVFGNVTVQNNATLTIKTNQYLSIDFFQFRLLVKDGSRVIIKNGGRVFRHPIHYDLKNNQDGIFGYYLKRVNGGVEDSFNPNFPFYAASTIKALESVHALRAVMNNPGSFNLITTILTVCSSNNTNCSDNPNSQATCQGVAPINETLQTSILRMMVPSDNESTNAIQELFGNGTPSIGRTAMNLTANNVLGMSNASALQHKLNCLNVQNNPFNTLTLADIAKLYEQVATNPAVFNNAFRTTFYSLMKNETGGMIGGQQEFFFLDVINQEGVKVGMSNAQINAFAGQVLLAHKAGNIGSSYRSVGGWIQLPINGGAQNRQYVYSNFVHAATVNNAPGIFTLADEQLREVIHEAMEAY